MKPDKVSNIKLFLLIEASKLANDKVVIDTWEAETATKMLEVYESRKKWNDENEELYSMRTTFQFRKIELYSYSQVVHAWFSTLEQVKEFADAELKEIS
jgi:hypothetical protein